MSLKNIFQSIIFPFSALVIVVGFTNCSGNDFSTPVEFADARAGTASFNSNGQTDLPSTASTYAPTCLTTVAQSTSKIKITFVVDMSGSNAGANGTDPQKAFRFGKIKQFILDNQSNSRISWQFIGFGYINEAYAFITRDSVTPIFTSSSSEILGAANTFMTIADQGATPYKAAINATAATIKEDLKTPQTDTKYVVLFLSDGMPSDYCPMVGPCNVPDRAALNLDIQKLVTLAQGKLTFNTLYYGPADTQAAETLKQAATAGGGVFIDTNQSTRGISLEQAVQVQTQCTTP